MQSTHLYQVSTKGKMKHQVITADGDKLITEWWQGDNGKRQKTEDTIVGKNTGRANETTAEEQCLLEYERKIQKKCDEGYSRTEAEALKKASGEIDVSQRLPLEFAPSKAISKLPANADPFDGTWLAERKFDGVCLVLHNTGTEKICYSRRMLPITDVVQCIPDLVDKLEKVPAGSIILGELTATFTDGSQSTRPTRGITSDKTDPEKAAERYKEIVAEGWTVEFNVYDVYFHEFKDITEVPFKDRNKIVESLYGKRDIHVFTEDMAHDAKEKGWEGFIIRQNDATVRYTTNGKAKRAGGYKFKFLETTDCIVTEVDSGNGKHQNRFARFHLAQYDNYGTLIDRGWAGGGTLGEKRMDEITAELSALGYKTASGVQTLNPSDCFAVEIEYQSEQGFNDKGQNCFEFPIILRTREDKPLVECVMGET
ncbi:MAG: hypothetical protein R3309_01720 [Reinekea sp.]|nr:hypothetical protein [Reinekea sp.]